MNNSTTQVDFKVVVFRKPCQIQATPLSLLIHSWFIDTTCRWTLIICLPFVAVLVSSTSGVSGGTVVSGDAVVVVVIVGCAEQLLELN